MMPPPNPFLSPIPGTTNLLLPRQTPRQPHLCPSPTTAWGPLGPTPTTTYLPCHTSPCSGLPKNSVIALTITTPLVLTLVAVIACAVAYRWGNNSNYNSGYDDGNTKGRDEGRREVEREVERARREKERQRKERERERERNKMWEDYRRREAQAMAAAANHRAGNAIRDQQAAQPVRGRRDSSSRPLPDLRDRYRPTPLQHHPTTAHQPPPSNNHRNPPPPTGPVQPPNPSHRSPPASNSHTPNAHGNAVPISLASRRLSHSSGKNTRERVQASVAAERFGNAAARGFPRYQRFEPERMRGGSGGRSCEGSGGSAAMMSGGRGRGSGVGDAAGGWEESGREELEREGVGAGDGGHGLDFDGNGTSPGPAFRARSPSLRHRSASPLSSPRTSFPSPSNERASATGSGHRAQDEEDRGEGPLGEARSPREESPLRGDMLSPRSRSSSPREDPPSPRGLSPSPPPSERSSVAGNRSESPWGAPHSRSPSPSRVECASEARSSERRSEERREHEEERDPNVVEEARWPVSQGDREGDEEERSSRSRFGSPRSKSPLPPRSELASVAGSEERELGEEERRLDVDEGSWPGPKGDGDWHGEARSRSPGPEVEVRDV